MKILLTGSTGFLGKYIKYALSDHEVITLGRSSCNIIFDEKNLISRLPNSDLVIHAAGKAHSIPETLAEKKEFYDSNLKLTLNLLDSLELSEKPFSFVFISSVSVYGLIVGENINENSSLLAEDPYGLSKIEAEKIIKKWCVEHNVICTILRLPLVIGNNPPGNLGAMIRGIKKGYYFNIAKGKAKKSMVLATDIAKFILAAAKIGGTYNLTDSYHPTLYELSICISRNQGKSFVPNMPLCIANVLAKIGDILGDNFPINSTKLSKITSSLTFDDSKARKAFGWKPTPVLDGFKIIKDA